MTSKWTAGPWKAETDNRIKHRQFVSSDERTICYVFTDDKTDANARLISAAPDMIEALRECHDTISYLKQYVEGQGLSAEDDCIDTLRVIKSVIEKATGQTIEVKIDTV